MRMFRRIPRQTLRQTMMVRAVKPDGTFEAPVAIIGVCFQEKQKVSDDAHRSAHGGGTIFIDAINSRGAFEVPVGSRVTVAGHSYYVRECIPVGDLFSRVEHWELEVE